MTRPDDLKSIRKVLLSRRRQLTETRDGASTELAALKEADRDPEYEETAQVASAESTLVTLLESHRRELQAIEAALARLDNGTFGICVDCELEIPPERLEALPYSLRCADCASAREVSRNASHHPPPSL